MSERPKGKSIGRRVAAKPPPARSALSKSEPPRKTAGKSTAPDNQGAAGEGRSKPAAISLRPAERKLLDALALRTHLSPAEVVARALQSYAAAVAPELRAAPRAASADEESPKDAERLFLSVDGRPEIEIDRPEFVLGSGEGTDLRLDLPLIAPRHARILLRDGRHLFEDLNTGKGSYRQGALIDVRFLEDGDEIDLGGFLPIRFRVERSGSGV